MTKKTTVDRVSGDQIEWLHVPVEDYSVGEEEMADVGRVVQEGKRTKKPTETDFEKASDEASANHQGFNAKMFSPMKAGPFTITGKFSGARSGAGALSSFCALRRKDPKVASAGSSGRTGRAGSPEPSTDNKPKKKTKVWDQDAEIAKCVRQLMTKCQAVIIRGHEQVEKVTHLHNNTDLQDQKAIDKTWLIMVSREPLLNAMLWIPSDDHIVEGATYDGFSESMRECYDASYKPVFAALSFVDKMEPTIEKNWSIAFGEKKADFEELPLFKNKKAPIYVDGQLALAPHRDAEGNLAPSDIGSFRADLLALCKASLAMLRFSQARAHFAATKNTLPISAKEMDSLLPIAGQQCIIQTFDARTEAGLKARLTSYKQGLDLAKEFVDRIKSTISTVSKALENHHREEQKKVQDKSVAEEEKKKVQAAKENLKKVRGLCKEKKSPVLLSYCGPMVSEVLAFEDDADCKKQCSEKPELMLEPFVVKTCTALGELVGQPSLKQAFAIFRTQLPYAAPCSKKKKAQCPFQQDSTADIRRAMQEFAPQRLTMPEETEAVSLWGGMPDMQQGALEHLALGSFRFTVGGTREIACLSAVSLLGSAAAQLESAGKQQRTYSDKAPLHDAVESVLFGMNEAAISNAEAKGMRCWRVTVGPGSLVFVPAGFAVVDRTIGPECVYGLRTSVVENTKAIQNLLPLETIMKNTRLSRRIPR